MMMVSSSCHVGWSREDCGGVSGMVQVSRGSCWAKLLAVVFSKPLLAPTLCSYRLHSIILWTQSSQ